MIDTCGVEGADERGRDDRYAGGIFDASIDGRTKLGTVDSGGLE